MHSRLLHGSAPNLSDSPRSLYICEYCAEDAYPLQKNHIPSIYVYDAVITRCYFPKYPKACLFLTNKPGLTKQ